MPHRSPLPYLAEPRLWELWETRRGHGAQLGAGSPLPYGRHAGFLREAVAGSRFGVIE
jgi:hypothetical protein